MERRALPLEPGFATLIITAYEGDRDSEGRYCGRGKAQFKDSQQYHGAFSDGKMHGEGRYVWDNGTVFEGTFKHNAVEGKGTYTWPDGSTYAGDVLDGLRNGHGTFSGAGGFPVYEGAWRAGKRHGSGSLWYDEDRECFYRGDWSDDRREGEGMMHFSSGNTYVGGWKADQKHGKGTMDWLDRRERYVGEWEHDNPHGHGEHVWLDERPKHADAATQRQMCNRYCGEWQAGHRHGMGTFSYADGALYKGEWLDSLKHGEGMFTFDDGSVYEGPFAYDKMAEPHRIMRAGSTAAANASAANRADTADESVRPRKNAADRKHGGAPRGRFGVDGSGTDGDGASGSASPSHSDASSAQIVPQLRLALDDVLPPEPAAAAPVGKAAAFVQTEQQRLEKLVFRYNSEFKAFYKQYSGVSTPAADAAGTAGVEGGSATEGVFAMTLAQLWRFTCDIHVTPDLLPIASVNRILVAMRRQHVLEVEVAKQWRHARRQRKKQGGTAAMIKAGIIPPPPPPPPLYREAEQMPSAAAAAAVTVTVSDPSDAPASPTRGADAASAAEASYGMHSSLQPILFREFVEVVVRLALRLAAPSTPPTSALRDFMDGQIRAFAKRGAGFDPHHIPEEGSEVEGLSSFEALLCGRSYSAASMTRLHSLWARLAGPGSAVVRARPLLRLLLAIGAPSALTPQRAADIVMPDLDFFSNPSLADTPVTFGEFADVVARAADEVMPAMQSLQSLAPEPEDADGRSPVATPDSASKMDLFVAGPLASAMSAIEASSSVVRRKREQRLPRDAMRGLALS